MQWFLHLIGTFLHIVNFFTYLKQIITNQQQLNTYYLVFFILSVDSHAPGCENLNTHLSSCVISHNTLHTDIFNPYKFHLYYLWYIIIQNHVVVYFSATYLRNGGVAVLEKTLVILDFWVLHFQFQPQEGWFPSESIHKNLHPCFLEYH